MVLEAGMGFLGIGRPDGAVFRGRRRELEDELALLPRDGAFFGKAFRRRLLARVLVLVQLVTQEDADWFVAEPGDGAGPAQIDGHVIQVDADA